MSPTSTSRTPTIPFTNDDNPNSTNKPRPPTIDDLSYHSPPRYTGLTTISKPDAYDLVGIIFCMRDSIANAVRLDPLLQNEQWYYDHCAMWMK